MMATPIGQMLILFGAGLIALCLARPRNNFGTFHMLGVVLVTGGIALIPYEEMLGWPTVATSALYVISFATACYKVWWLGPDAYRGAFYLNLLTLGLGLWWLWDGNQKFPLF